MTDIECDCLEDTRPDNWNDSESGYYLTDLEYGIPLDPSLFQQEDCYCGLNIWQLMQKSIADATKDFCRDLSQELYSKYDSNLATFSGKIGKFDFNKIKSTTGKYAMICLDVKKKVRGGYFVLNEICLGLNCEKEVEIFVVNADYPDEVIGSTVVTSEEGKFVSSKLDQEILLPLYDERCSKLRYKIYYEIPEGCSPLLNKFKCCSDNFGWMKFFKSSGGNSDSIEDCKCSSSCAFGLSVGGYNKCKGLEWICDLGQCEGFDFMEVVARTIQFRAISKLIYALMNNGGEISSFCLLSSERLLGKRSHLKKVYGQNLKWICENIPMNLSDCFRCKQNKKFKSYEL